MGGHCKVPKVIRCSMSFEVVFEITGVHFHLLRPGVTGSSYCSRVNSRRALQ